MNRACAEFGSAGEHRLRAHLIRVAAVVGLAVVATFGATTAAFAHNVLLSTDPAAKSTVATLPDTVTLTFNEPAQAIGGVIRVVGPAGDVAAGAPSFIDRQVKQGVRPGSPAGAYTVQWRVTSLDGHPISGEFSFTASAGNGGTAPPLPSGQSTAVSTAAPAPVSGSGTGSGSATTIIALLVVAAVLVVVAGVYLAIRRPGPSLAPDETSPGETPPTTS